MSEQVATLAQQLQESTRELHQRVERMPVQQELARGTLSRENYIRYLCQMLLIQTQLDTCMGLYRKTIDPGASLIHDYYFQSDLVHSDICFLKECSASNNRNPFLFQDHPILPETYSFAIAMNRSVSESPISLLGFLYVFEGSKNGSKFIANSLRKSYSLPDGAGVKYFDPYGENQKPYWAAFKESLAALTLTSAESEAIVEAAKEAFSGMIDITGALQNQSGS